MNDAIKTAIYRHYLVRTYGVYMSPEDAFVTSLSESGILLVETEQYESMRRKCELYDEMTRKENE